MSIETSKRTTDERKLAKIYSALGEPNRLRLVRALLQHDEMTCGQLAEMLDVTASHHIAELLDCGLVDMRKVGRHHVLWLKREVLTKYAPAIL
jgi:ArsR family transcriptional regulator